VLPKVKLFGEPRALVANQEHRFQPSRRYQFLAYLAYINTRVSREKLADVFWSHTDSQAARRNLRKVLFEAKNLEWAVGFDHDEQGASWPVETDVFEFEAAIKQKDWSKAVPLYTGSFLDGLQSNDGAEFDVWLEQERLRLEELYQVASENYIETLERQGKTDEAIDFLKQLLARDALNETLHRTVMRLEFKRGNTEAALEQFESCREVLQKELSVEPLPETLELLKTIEQGGGTQAKRALVLKSANDVPNLPVNLVGREKLLQEALQLLQQGERVLLHGFGGMGKTALAATVTKHFLDNKQTAVWLQVGSDNPEVTFDALAQPFDAGQDIAQAEDKPKALQEVLQKQRLSLLVLDDVWNAYTLSKVMEALPKGLPLLVTSRQRYPKLTKVYVDRLERSAALDVLALYAESPPAPFVKGGEAVAPLNKGGRGDSDAAKNRLCELLGDHPFALRLAGLALQENGTSAEQLYEQIKHNPHDFKMPGELREVGRESVGSLLSVSLETLEDRAYETFLSYGLLESPVASAGFLAGCLDREVNLIEDALFALVQRGLAERVSKAGSDLVSYRIHDLAHSYAKSNRFQRAGTLVRSGLAFLKNHKDDVELLELDISNILAAAQKAKERARDNELIEFVYLLTVDGTYYLARGHTRRSVKFLELAIDKAKQKGMIEKAHYLLGKLGDYYQNFLGKSEQALKIYREAATLAHESGNKGREAIFLGVMGQVKAQQQKFEEATKYANQAHQLAKESQDDYVLSDVLGQVSYVAILRKEMLKANGLLCESLDLLDKLEKTQTVSSRNAARDKFYLLLNLGDTESHLGNFEKAFLAGERALAIAQEQYNQVWMGYAFCGLGEIYHKAGNRIRASENMRQALKIFEGNDVTQYIEIVLSFMESNGYVIDRGVNYQGD
jgi:DNA-binding SARP family transcriptional activator